MTRGSDSNQLDRRKRRSRAALRAGLLELIGVKPYDTITIDDVADTADVSRATFYAHYRDKADLLAELSDEMISEAAARATSIPAQDTQPGAAARYSGSAAAQVIVHAAEHRDLYQLVLSGAGGKEPRKRLISSLQTAVASVFSRLADTLERTPRMPMEIISRAFTGALLAVIEAWLAGEYEGTPDEIAAIFMHGQVDGLQWALGLNEGELAFSPPH